MNYKTMSPEAMDPFGVKYVILLCLQLVCFLGVIAALWH